MKLKNGNTVAEGDHVTNGTITGRVTTIFGSGEHATITVSHEHKLVGGLKPADFDHVPKDKPAAAKSAPAPKV